MIMAEKKKKAESKKAAKGTEKAEAKIAEAPKPAVKEAQAEVAKATAKEPAKAAAAKKLKKKKAQVAATGKALKKLPKRSEQELAKVRKLQTAMWEKRHPVFRGRWGKKSIWNVFDEKWDKWRRPRGQSSARTDRDGAWPKSGYRTAEEIRFLHPSGHPETIVHNSEMLSIVPKGNVVRIAATVGKRKRLVIRQKAAELGLKIINFGVAK